MRKLTLYIFFLFLACKPNTQEEISDRKWETLWNGEDFTGWHTYLGTPYNIEKDSLGNAVEPFGVDHDPLEVIKVIEMDDGNAIRISGIAWGMIYTEEEYSNYHLKLKVKWGEGMHPPREDGPRDSGLLTMVLAHLAQPIIGWAPRNYRSSRVIWATTGLWVM